ncbi:MAG TPA: putative glycoside hydrolase [Streptosporangiaceae bacterium]|nr:putative glycoside hydrolase [Streptosporangiaceae bacterium]
MGEVIKPHRPARNRRLIAGILVGAVAMAAVSFAVVGAPHATASARAQPRDVKPLLVDENSTNYDWAVVAPKYGAIILNAWNYPWIPAIKHANPAAVVLEYKDLPSSRPGACRQSRDGRLDSALPTGVDYCWARAHHPGWFLRSKNGQLVQYRGWPGTFEMDYGNQAYEHRWAANVISDLTHHGWNGVFADNALTGTGYGVAARYPTNRAVQAAMGRMIRYVGPRVKSVRKLFIPNVGGDVGYPGIWARWLPYTSGEFDEFTWSLPGLGIVKSTADWHIWEAEMRACAATRSRCLFHTGEYVDQPTQVVDFALASYLLYTNGTSALGMGDDLYAHYPQMYQRLGAPAGLAHQPRPRVWRRAFTHGSVTVNLNTWTGTITTH